MITLNPFVENNKARINQFLNNLCEVGDFYDTLEVGRVFPKHRAEILMLWTDAPIHGSVEEGPCDSYHVERIVQYSFPHPATY